MENSIDMEYFKEKLLEEKARLEKDLSTIGRINPDNPNDWEAVPPNDDFNDRSADQNKLADNIEEYESRTATLKEIEDQLEEVRQALKRIDDGKYGICEISGEPIEKDRLEANPAARTCKAHIK